MIKQALITIALSLPLAVQAQQTLTPEEQLRQAEAQLVEAQKALEAARQAAADAAKARAQAEEEARLRAAQQAELARKREAMQAEAERMQREAQRMQEEAARIQVEAARQHEGSEAPAAAQPAAPAATATPAPTPATPAKGWAVPTLEKKAAPTRAEEKAAAATQLQPYLAGAVPLTAEGKVAWTLERDLPGLSKAQVYERTLAYLQAIADGPDHLEGSRVALVNPGEGIIAAQVKEWLVFSTNLLSLDRSEFNYTLIAHCTDGHLQLSMERITYHYEADRPSGFKLPAEQVIVDKVALSKNGDKLTRAYGKFRRNTIDRKNAIFSGIE